MCYAHRFQGIPLTLEFSEVPHAQRVGMGISYSLFYGRCAKQAATMAEHPNREHPDGRL